ncbi:group II intron reverse transcriptase/maturase [Solemya velum gill symbiont]|uniref:group II intron reverse transcriptase/maturase n=1 Tax=Solemya velum gill symbiont TaxID=2340 RepID=UPI00099752CD|nr:group II intron reverse transcriptase/maturase [Solemya velum gill symbiont]OOY83878.1 group II intron reverse transcriptase/maturase [Solemya velum gill symbiont]
MKLKLDLIAMKARQDKRKRFTALIHHINEENLAACYKELKRNKACGIDNVTVEAYGENLTDNISSLVRRLKDKTYRPQPVKRVYIPKPGKQEKRGLGLPTVEDKLVQLMLKKLLEAIYENDFLDCSYGFRSKLGCHDAIKALDTVVMTKPINYIVEVDIRKFFDNVSHYWLQRCLEERIADKNLLWLVRRFLKAGIVEAGEYQASKVGTPQGGVISPLLANIYLHYILDLWFEKKIKPKGKGYMQLIRYCDDFVVCCQNKQDAEEFLNNLRLRLAEFNLMVAEDKTKIIEFGRDAWRKSLKTRKKPDTFTFLGFTHYCDTSRRGKFIMGHKTSKQSLARALKSVNEWLRAIRNQVKLKDWIAIVKRKLQGHYNYFGISGNIRCLQKFYSNAWWLILKWINRRSDKKSMTIKQFIEYCSRNLLPKPKIKYSLYTFSANHCNTSLKSRVWENHKHGSVGVSMAIKLKTIEE